MSGLPRRWLLFQVQWRYRRVHVWQGLLPEHLIFFALQMSQARETLEAFRRFPGSAGDSAGRRPRHGIYSELPRR